MVGFAVAQLLSVFLCVTLHEYGHSLAAKRYGVDTIDITLLPIGGVARLKRIPRVPMQEFVIAVAGPAVNVVIVMLLGSVLAMLLGVRAMQLLTLDRMGLASQDLAIGMSPWLDFIILLMAINAWLVLFNMIPAFPMDGGRVLRSLLATKLSYGAATRIAQLIGMACAAMMAAFAMASEPVRWPMLLIAVFIVYAGRMEARQVELTERFGGLSAGDVMSHSPPFVSIDWTVAQLQQWWQHQPSFSAAVVGLGNVVVGVLSVDDLAKHLAAHPEDGELALQTTAGQLADHDFPRVEVSTPLHAILEALPAYKQLPVINRHYQLVGWLDFESLATQPVVTRSIP